MSLLLLEAAQHIYHWNLQCFRNAEERLHVYWPARLYLLPMARCKAMGEHVLLHEVALLAEFANSFAERPAKAGVFIHTFLLATMDAKAPRAGKRIGFFGQSALGPESRQQFTER